MELLVTEVGMPDSARKIDAPNDYHAVAEAADCAVNDVALPIWTRGTQEPSGKWTRGAVRCYMPLDNTGRQWLVEGALP